MLDIGGFVVYGWSMPKFSSYGHVDLGSLVPGEFIFSRLLHGETSEWSLFMYPDGLVITGPMWTNAIAAIEVEDEVSYWHFDPSRVRTNFTSEEHGLSVMQRMRDYILTHEFSNARPYYFAEDDPFEGMLEFL